MATAHPNVLTPAELDALLALPEVIAARERLDTQDAGSVSLSVPLTDAMKSALQDRLGLDLDAVESVPMRWIKGDTHPHVDRTQARDAFTNTYLMYVNDSPGEFIVGDASYPIASGTAYVFPEGTNHETQNTGTVPRLLLGPMSEAGRGVGATTTISANGATDTVYIRQLTSGGSVEYRINTGLWAAITFPCTVSNTNGTPVSNILKILFTTNITTSDITTYFICGSNGLQFGDSALPASGVRPTITITENSGYTGLIQNGTNSVDGYNNIYVYNLIVDQRGLLPATNAGHIGQTYFGIASTNNYFVNCTSLGTVANGGGGIVGANAATDSGSMTLIGCSNVISAESPLLADSGGIVGSAAGNVTCVQCWSEGEFADSRAGGIFGSYANGATATKCYSSGEINSSTCGGIFGSNAQYCTGSYCYSRGPIAGPDAGGIYGANATESSLTFSYSSGAISGVNAGGLLGNNATAVSTPNCYAANNDWVNTTARAAIGGPGSDPGRNDNWVSTSSLTSTPYELASFGYTPYTQQNITVTYPPSLVQTYSATVQAGGSTAPAVKTATFSLIPGPTAYPTITINPTTGAITASAATAPGTYTLYVRNTGSYNNTEFILTVTAAPPAGSNGCCPTAAQLQDLDNTTLTQVKRGVIIGLGPRNPAAFSSYSDYITYKLTKSFLRN